MWFLLACVDARTADILELKGDAIAGAWLYAIHCAECHAADGIGDIGPDLTRSMGYRRDSYVVASILWGRGLVMPPFGDDLDDDEVADLYAHLLTLAEPP